MTQTAHRRCILSVGLALGACATQPVSYLRLPLDDDGAPRTSPVIINARRGRRRLRLLGSVHSRDPDDPSLARLETAFRAFRPNILVHENTAPANLRDRAQAITRAGDLGLGVWLAATQNLPIVSGDLPEKIEFPTLVDKLGVDLALTLVVVQRLLIGLNGDLDRAEIDYAGFHRSYLVASGFPDLERHRRFEGFLHAFQSVQGAPLTTSSWDPELASPLRRSGPLNAASRMSHRLRDDHLMGVLRRVTTERHRVLCLFGAWHVLALAPLARAGRLFG